MNFGIFKDLEGKVNDYMTCCEEARNAERNAKELLTAVEKRIESNRASTQARINELKAQINTPDKSETVRRVAAMELKTLESKTFTATDEERKAITDEILMSRSAMRDADRGDIKNTFAEAKDELESIRLQTVGANGLDFTLMERWLAGIEDKLAKL
jgi:hypothetical protein